MSTRKPEEPLFWGRDPDGSGEIDGRFREARNRIEPWGADGRQQQTESDLLVLQEASSLAVEAKLGRPDARVSAWCRSKPGMRPEYEAHVRQQGLKCFGSGFEWNEAGHRFYQLARNWLLAHELVGPEGRGYLLVVVNARNRNIGGRTHEEELGAFRCLLPEEAQDRVGLVTWQQMRDVVGEFGSSECAALSRSLKAHPLL